MYSVQIVEFSNFYNCMALPLLIIPIINNSHSESYKIKKYAALRPRYENYYSSNNILY